MEITVSTGRGYQVVDLSADEGDPRGGVACLDASYSPVRSVSYSVENARVEQRTDLDKLVMEIETNGTIDPEEAVRRAARVLHEQIAVFVQLKESDRPTPKCLRSELIRCCSLGR